MTRLIGNPSNAGILMATIVAAGFILSFPSPALAEDWGRLVPEIFFSQFGPGIAGFYAFAVLIALAFKVFRSRTALYISFVLSAIASIPALLSLVWVWKYPDMFGGFVRLAVLHSFAWAAPIIQYLLVRRKTLRSTQARRLTNDPSNHAG